MIRVESVSLVWIGILLTAMTGCSPRQVVTTNPVTHIPPPSVSATVPCEQELIARQILEIRPAQVVPGSEITIIGSGGYIRDACGSYIRAYGTLREVVELLRSLF